MLLLKASSKAWAASLTGLLLGGACLSGCSSTADEPQPAASGVEIMPAAATTVEVEEVSRGAGVLTAFTETEGYSVVAFTLPNQEKPASYTSNKLIDNVMAIPKGGTGDNGHPNFKFSDGSHFYPGNGNYVHFYAYYPRVASLTNGTTASYTLDGTTDVMWATPVDGGNSICRTTGGTQAQPDFVFQHMLQQIRFKLVADSSWPSDRKVTNISITNVNKTFTLNVMSGAVSGSSNGDNTLSIGNAAGWVPGASNGDALENILMIGSGQGSLNLSISITGRTKPYTIEGVTFTPAAGKSHLITLTFKATEIRPECTSKSWELITTKSSTVFIH